MKLKNVKEGQRVQCKRSTYMPERKGALGTIREPDNPQPFVEWDDDQYSRTTYNGYRVSSESIKNLRKVK